MKKRILSVLLAVAMAFSLLPAVYADGAVCHIGDTSYNSLAEAVAAVPSNGTATIVMDSDVSGLPQLVLNGENNITLDLNGKTLAFTASGYAILLNKNKTFFTLKDSSAGMTGAITNSSGSGIECTAYQGGLTIEGGTIKDCTNSGWGAGIYLQSGELVMTGGRIENCVWGSPSTSLALFITQVNEKCSSIYGGTINGGSTLQGNVIVYGGSFSKAQNSSGNSFKWTQYLDASATVSESGDYWVVSSGPAVEYVAQVGDAQYETLEAALTAANGGTVTLLKDHAGDVTLTSCTLEFAERTVTGAVAVLAGVTAVLRGGTVTGAVSNAGSLTIESGVYNGAVQATSVTGGSFSAAANGSETFALASAVAADRIAVKNGDYWVIQEKPDNSVAKVGNVKYDTLAGALAAAGGGAVILLKDLTLEATAVLPSCTLDLNGKTLTGDLAVEEGAAVTLQGGTLAGSVTNAGTLTIAGGSYSGSVAATAISGGTFTGTVNAGTIGGGSFGPASNVTVTVEISDGSFEGTVASAASISGGSFSGTVSAATAISGGTFAAANNSTAGGDFTLAASVVEGRTARRIGDNWVIRNAGNVAMIGDVEYPTVQEALDSITAASQVTITMIADSQEDIVFPDGEDSRTNKRDIVLDLNGYVLCGTGAGPVIYCYPHYSRLTVKDGNPDSVHADSSLPAGGVITGGHAEYGGGICTRGIVYFQGGTIFDCTATCGGGGIAVTNSGFAYDTGVSTMSGGSISHCSVTNFAADASGGGGGIFSRGKFAMSGGRIEYCTVTGGETAGFGGGGVYTDADTFTLSDDAVIDHCARYIQVSGNFVLNGIGGGGVAAKGNMTFNMTGGTISNCTVTATADSEDYSFGFGGGILAGGQGQHPTVLNISGGTIINCSADKEGGGVQAVVANFTMTGGTITECTCYSKGGGGISYCNGLSEIELTGGRVTNCKALWNGHELKPGELPGGGGICGYDAPLTLGGDFLVTGCVAENGRVSESSATGQKCVGGGILLGNPGAELWLKGHPVVSGNTSAGEIDNVYLYTGVTVRVIDEIENGCSIGLTTHEKPTLTPEKSDVVVTRDYENYNGSDAGDLYFFSDNPAYAVENLAPVGEGSYGEVILTLGVDRLKLVYHANGGAFPENFTDTYSYSNPSAGDPPVFSVTIASGNGVTRTGFNFQCWNTAPDGSGKVYSAGSAVSIAGRGTVHLYAQWHRIVSYNMTVSSDLTMHFYVQGIPADGATGYRMVFLKTGSGAYLSESACEGSTASGYRFTMEKLYPQNMTDTITANLYDANNTRVASITNVSIQGYCDALYSSYGTGTDDFSQAVVAIAADMLEYGAAAQRVRKVTSGLANDLGWVAGVSSLTKTPAPEISVENVQSIETAPGHENEDVKLGRGGLILGSSIYIYYEIQVEANSGGYELRDGQNNVIPAYDRLQETGRSAVDLKTAGTRYAIVGPIKATGGASGKYVNLYKDGKCIAKACDSVNSYVDRALDSVAKDTVYPDSGNLTLGDVCRALYFYCASAKAYSAAAKARQANS